jgi:translation initiation factor IF-2
MSVASVRDTASQLSAPERAEAVRVLRRFKEDVRTVATGYECGIGLDNFQDVKEGDQVETYEMVEIPR